MRMKDMIERTGLTDRAVRLYIEEGLLTPRQESSYSGRRSFEFSEEDAQQLETISTLRRAGFSVAAIREMLMTPTAAAQYWSHTDRNCKMTSVRSGSFSVFCPTSTPPTVH